jgi:hypothetical protein
MLLRRYHNQDPDDPDTDPDDPDTTADPAEGAPQAKPAGRSASRKKGGDA